MRDPDEGIAPDGTIRTGVARDRIPAAFLPVLDAAIASVTARQAGASLYVYGSVATGQAEVGRSDVDLITLDLDPADVQRMAAALTARFADQCRGVGIGAGTTAGLAVEGDEAYGNRVFLRHYAVHLAGPDPAADLPDVLADAHAARGFNGDIGRQAARWHRDLGRVDPKLLGRRIARKALFAVAGLVSVHDRTWTTDRAGAATRWAAIQPEMVDGLMTLVRLAEGAAVADARQVRELLDGVVADVVARFADDIGVWDT